MSQVWRKSKDASKAFGLNNWKDGVALSLNERHYGKRRFEDAGINQKFCFGYGKFEIPL